MQHIIPQVPEELIQLPATRANEETRTAPPNGPPSPGTVGPEGPSTESPTLTSFVVLPTTAPEHLSLQQTLTSGLDDLERISTDGTLPCNVIQAEEGSRLFDSSQTPTSPIERLPAEGALPLEPSTDDAETVPVNRRIDQQPLLVYSRRQRNQSQTETSDHHQQIPQAAQTPVTSASSPAEARAQAFIEQISLPVVNLCTPQTQPRRRRQQQRSVTTHAPRRSRRIAKLPPEYQQKAAATVCRQLGFADQQQQRCAPDGTMEKYSDFFNKPLSREHVRALAALLGKELPPAESIQGESPAVEVV